jgi:hypothetical protein
MTPGAMTPRYPQDNYGGRNNYRPDSYIDNRSNYNGNSKPDGYYDNSPKPSNGYYPSRARYPRTASEPQFNNGVGAGIYPVPGNQQSYETVTTASGSGSSGEPLGYTTDPSSESSSLDRIQPVGIPESWNSYGGTQNNQMSSYGSNGYGGYPAKPTDSPNVDGGYQNGGYQNGSYQNGGYQNGGYQNGGPPPIPPKGGSQIPPRVPIKLGTPTGAPLPQQTSGPEAGEKRKSWFGLKRKG